MPAYKNKDNGSWYVVTQYTDWTGERKPKCKRGFATRRESLEWEQKFQQQSAGDLDMSFEAFVEIYTTDLKARLKESTWQTKEHIIQTKILPYFGKRKINEITTKDVIAWQNELLAYRDEKHKPYSQSYLKTLHNQLSAIFNHAVRFYDLRSNPAAKAGNMGSEERKEMLFWTKEEYQKFAEEMMDKPISYYAFQMLYWTGIREGELLALTPADFDFERGTVKISKTYQRLKGKDEVYRHLTQTDIWCESIVDLYEKGISVSSMSKVFSLAGIRLGWIASHDKEAVSVMLSHRDYNLFSCGMLDETIAALALAHSDKLLVRNRAIVRENLEIVDKWIKNECHASYVKPMAGTTALIHYDLDIPSYDLCVDMYKRTGAFVTPGDCFEEKSCFRLGYACDKETLVNGLAAISKYFEMVTKGE